MLGDQLLLARKHAGIRQVDAADHAHITQPYLSMIEHNLHKPSPPILQRLLRLYGVAEGAADDAPEGDASRLRK